MCNKGNINYLSVLWLLLCQVAIISCRNNNHQTSALFTKLSGEETGIHFSNTITENDSVNLITDEYAYMGSGIGVGDFNNDGLPDLFFGGSQTGCKLYLNLGNHKFRDITKSSGIATNVWCTGVSIVDINNDGYPDIYVCVSGYAPAGKRKNLLFINNHNLTFTESAAEYGLADTSYSTQAVFLDYDKDGRMDMYLVNHEIHPRVSQNDIVKRDTSGHSIRSDKLYRNMGNLPGTNHPFFKDVSLSAGIKDDGYGLGVVVSDFNNDGWPDIYVTNDYLSNDLLWINNKNGTFTNIIGESLAHQSYSSMGVDAADINNDGLPDIASLDMQPEDNYRKKMMYSFMTYSRYESERRAGYQPEFMRNMLQLNRGVQQKGDTAVPYFSEIGQLAGISATDWSWSVLMADFENSGNKDIYITNGMGRDLINADFINFRADTYGTGNTLNRERTLRSQLASLDSVPLRNYYFHNNGNYTFSNESVAAGFTEPSISNGAVYVDLDNDGDLDLVTNNINQEASVYINNSIQKGKQNTSNHFLNFSLRGDSLNRNGFGAKVILWNKGTMQMLEENPVRGYASSVDQRLHFGLGNITHPDSAVVIWPNEKQQVLKHPFIDTTIVLDESHASVINKNALPAKATPLFKNITDALHLDYTHKETFFNDFAFNSLLPQKYSQLGPFISTGDVNGDGLTDFFVGGAFKQSGKIFIQQKDGSFKGKDLVSGPKYEEDMQSALVDVDGDHDLDLIVVGGSDEFNEGSKYYIPRLYLNDGKGNFTLSPAAFPPQVNTIGQSLSITGGNGNGPLRIFIGGRVSLRYPYSPQSFLLEYRNGSFMDITKEVCPALSDAGMITSSVWTDFDGDGQMDLVIAGEWMPLRFFKGENGKLKEVTESTGLKNNNGMWRSLLAVDLDGDGDMDLIAGNLGENNPYGVTKDTPLEMYAKDFEGNGTVIPIIAYYIPDKDGVKKLEVGANLNQLAKVMPSLKNQFSKNEDFAKAGFNDILTKSMLEGALHLDCQELSSCWFENVGHGKFVKHILPVEAQFAPVNAILVNDFDRDGKKDILMAGNEYQTEPMIGRYDASYGLFLKGLGGGKFLLMKPADDGFFIKGNVKDLKLIKDNFGNDLILAAVNDQPLAIFECKKTQK